MKRFVKLLRDNDLVKPRKDGVEFYKDEEGKKWAHIYQKVEKNSRKPDQIKSRMYVKRLKLVDLIFKNLESTDLIDFEIFSNSENDINFYKETSRYFLLYSSGKNKAV